MDIGHEQKESKVMNISCPYSLVYMTTDIASLSISVSRTTVVGLYGYVE